MDQFIADVKAVQAAHTDPKDILQRVAPLANRRCQGLGER